MSFDALAEHCTQLQLGIVNVERVRFGMRRGITLRAMYTDMDVVTPSRLDKGEGAKDTSAMRW